MSEPLYAWQRLRAGNHRGRQTTRTASDVLADRPIAAVFRCADSALASEAVFGQDPGAVIDVSTWGHVTGSGVIGTLEYAVENLEVPLIVVLGHPGCPAMGAAMRAWTEAALPAGASRTAVEQAIASMVRRGVQADSVDTLTATHVADVGLALLERSPIIARRVDAGACGIVCITTGADGRLRTHAAAGPVGETSETLLECV
jgi:carbonic anhydrase